MNIKKTADILRVILVSSIILSLFAFTACGSDDSSGAPGTMNFYATDLTDNSIYSVTADLAYEGDYCLIYKDRNDTHMDKITAQSMGVEFDSGIYTKIKTYFGAPSDVDDNNKVIILILDIRDGYISSGSYVAGYFDPANEFDSSQISYSNESDMLYMDSYPGGNDPDGFKQTMAHEFQHLVNFTQKVFIQNSDAGFDTWINEGMSSAAEQIYEGAQIQWKINYYNNDPDGDIEKGQRFVCWDNNKSSSYDSVVGNYSTVYLFFQWLRIQSDNGNGIFKIIMDDSNDDGTAVFNAAKLHVAGFDDSSFGNLLRDWLITNIISDGLATGYNSYNGEIAQLTNHFYAGASTTLLPGECIYKTTAGNSYPDILPIRFAGISSSDVPDYTSPYPAGTLLVFNSSMNDAGDAVATGTLTSVVDNPTAVVFSKTYSDVKENYPIDVVRKIKDISALKNKVQNE